MSDDLVKRLRDRAASARRIRNEFFEGTQPLDGDIECLCDNAAARIEELERERDAARQEVIDLAWGEGKLQDEVTRLTALLKEAEGVAVLLSAHIPDWASAMSDWDLGGEAAIDDLREMEEAVSALLARLQEPQG